jgi:hypothetical protein
VFSIHSNICHSPNKLTSLFTDGGGIPENLFRRKKIMQNNISIGDTSKITGVSEKQLRYWENKNILTDIDRVICGARSYRRYSYDQVKFIKKVKERLDRGFTLEASARLAKEEAGEGGEACQD